MKKSKVYGFLILSSGCLAAAPALGQEAEEDGGFSFSDDSFSLEAAPPPEPIRDNYVEGGIGYVSDDSYRFGRFDGLTDEGAFLNGSFRYLRRGQWDEEDLRYWEARGENLGLDNRSLQIEGGKQGKYRLFLHYDEIPYYGFPSETPYLGVGSDNLTLPSDWVSNPQSDFNTATQNLPDLAASLEPVKIKTERTRYGGGVVWDFDRHWSASLSGVREKKDGKKPLGVAWGTSGQNAVAVIVPEPVDYRTDRFDAELGYRDKKMQFNLAYQLSQFENRKDSLSVRNPFTYAGWPPATSYPDGVAEMDLAPDNTAHSLTLAGGYNFTESTRLTANLGYSRYRQDDALLPYTANPDLTVTRGVPRNSLDAEITNLVGNVELYGRPTQELDYTLRYRYTDRDNDTPRDLYIYVRGDAENQQIGGDEPNYRYNTPYGFTENLLGGDLGYRLAKDTKLDLAYEYRNTDRTYSERTETDEHEATLALQRRFNKKLSGRAEFSHSWRRGSDYEGTSTLLDSYTPTYASSLGPDGFINHPDLRMYHLANRDRNKGAMRMTYAANNDLTFGGRLSFIDDDYKDSTLGLTGADGWGLTLDTAYQVNEKLSVSGFYAFDDREAKQAGWSFQGGANELEQAEDPERRWWVDNDYNINTLGVGMHWKATPKLSLSADYVYSDAVTKTNTKAGAALETGPFPDLKSRTHSLRSELGYDLTNQTTLGVSYIYERYRGSDWQTDGVQPDTLGRVLSLEATDPDYDVHVIMAWARFQF